MTDDEEAALTQTPKIAVIGSDDRTIQAHADSIQRGGTFELAATLSTADFRSGADFHTAASEFYRARSAIRAVTICTVAEIRYLAACEALDAGKNVFLEAPVPTTSELTDLAARAQARERVLFSLWGLQDSFATAQARRVLAKEGVASIGVRFRGNTDQNRFEFSDRHASQKSRAFDAAIEALAMLAKATPFQIFVESAKLRSPDGFPHSQEIAIKFKSPEAQHAKIGAVLSLAVAGPNDYSLNAKAGSGTEITIGDRGAKFVAGDRAEQAQHPAGLQQVYVLFASCLQRRYFSIDLRPPLWLADALMIATRA